MPESATKPAPNIYLSDPDVQLMLRVKQGDDAAFQELVEAYQDRVVAIFTNIVGNHDSAEDLAQDVFLRIYRARLTYEPAAKFSTWLFRIANNLALNTKRNKARRKETQFGNADSQPVVARPLERNIKEKSALMPARILDRSELHQVVRDSLEELNERQRMAVLLHKFEEMSYAEIADVFEMSVPAVKSLLSRAREKLREVLEGYIQKG